MELNIGDQFDLEVIDLCSGNNGYDYILALGPDDKTHKIYNIIKCQYTSLPDTIYGIVTAKDQYGSVKIKQDEPRVLQEHYALGHPYIFKISDCRTDKNDKKYYVLEDDFSYQRWYSDDDFDIGDEILLEAKDITNSGYIYYARHESPVFDEPTANTTPAYTVPTSSNHPVFDGGEESETVEYKTSIVFKPGQSEPNIDKQMFTIVCELAAFMNTNGGTMYIGIHDKTHEILGIEKDLHHLNEGESQYADSYKPDYDHYQLKIRDTVVSLCSAMAGSLLHISFPEQEGVTYCRVDVDAAKRPVWVKGNMLYQRQGNQKQMLRGEDITQYVGERIGHYIVEMAGDANHSNMTAESMTSMIHNAVKLAINYRRKSVAATVATPSNADIKYWIVWLNDGTYVKKKEQATEPNVFKQIPVTADVEDGVVVFCYGSGTMNTVKMKDFKKGANLNKVRPNGMNPNENPMEIFICHPSNLVAIHSADTGGTEYIKLHHISDVNSTASGKNQGAYIIPKNQGHVLEFKLVTPVQADNVKLLIAQKKDTSQSFGSPWFGIDVKDEVDYLSSI